MITRDQPIPGIEEIPDTVLEAGSSLPSATPQRTKPWEKNELGGAEQSPRDVIRMLQPIVTSEQAPLIKQDMSDTTGTWEAEAEPGAE